MRCASYWKLRKKRSDNIKNRKQQAEQEIGEITGILVFRGGAYLTEKASIEISRNPEKWASRRLVATDAISLQVLWDLAVSLMEEKLERIYGDRETVRSSTVSPASISSSANSEGKKE